MKMRLAILCRICFVIYIPSGNSILQWHRHKVKFDMPCFIVGTEVLYENCYELFVENSYQIDT
jgi:hypothetical protein